MNLLRSIVAMIACLVAAGIQAAPTFQLAGTEVAWNGNGNQTVTWPVHQAGDIALLFVESTGGQVASLGTAAGFAAVPGSPQATGTTTNGTRLTVFWARATSPAMANPAVTIATGDHGYARIVTYRGVIETGDPWDVTGGGVKTPASTSVTVTGVTTTVDDTRIVQAVARDNDSAAAAFSAQTNANLTGITERSDLGTATGNGGGFGLWDGVMASAGATGNTTATVVSSINAFLTIALRPPASASRFAVATGNWDATATWSSVSCAGTFGAPVPAAGADVTICATRTVAVNVATANLGSLTVAATGALNVSNTLAVAGLTDISGALTMLSATGNKTFTGGVTINNGGSWTHNAVDENVSIGGDLINNGAFNSTSASDYAFTTSGDWGGANPISFGDNVTVSTGAVRTNSNASVTVNGDLTLAATSSMANSGSVTITEDLVGSNATTSVWTQNDNSTLSVGLTLLTTGTLNAAATGNTVIYSGAGGQTVKNASAAGDDYWHLMLTGGGNKDPASGVTYNILGSFTVNGPVWRGTQGTDPVVSVDGDIVVTAGSFITGTGNYALKGNLVNDATFTHSGGIFTFNGSTAQTVSGTAGTTTFTGMALDNAAGLAMSGGHNITVSTALTLTSGRITTGAGILFVSYTTGNGAIAGAGAASFVVGNLRKNFLTGTNTRAFEVGTEAGGVRAATVSITLNVGTAGYFTATTTAGDHPEIGASTLDEARSINRTWTLTPGTLVFNSNAANSLTFNYVDPGDYDAGANYNAFYLARYAGAAWTEVALPVRAATSLTYAGGAAITQAAINSIWQIGERAPAVSLVSALLLCGTGNSVEVVFSKPVTDATALNIANYALSGGVTISAAAIDAGKRVVTLTTSTMAAAASYTLTVNNIAAVAGGTIAANSTATFWGEGGDRRGLLGSYYANMALTAPVAGTRVDGPVDFNWAAGPPGVGGIGVDGFSVRWTGYITPTLSGTYTFRTQSDDGVRLYVAPAVPAIINNWTDHAAAYDISAPQALVAGTRYAVTMEFYENGGDAVARLEWQGPGTAGAYVAVPNANLSHTCGVRQPVAFYKMDEGSWPSAGAVIDSSGNGLHGTAQGGAVPTLAKLCYGAQLNGTTRYIEVADNNLLDMAGSFTVAAWIRANALTSALKTIVSKDENFEFHLTSAGQINWWWQNAGSVAETITTTGTPLVANTWYHVAIVYAPGAQTIYIDGVSRGTGTFNGGLLVTADPLQIGSDQGLADRFFDGLIDEVRLYDSALTASQVATIIADTRSCPIYIDHIRIEHDGIALTCQPETVTVKACSDAACSTTYGGAVTTTLTPAGWVGGDTVVFSGGSTTAQLRKLTAGAATLGAGATAPAPLNITRCFVGGTETCSLDYRTAGFIFDVPTLTSCKTSAAVTITAVRADATSQKCMPAFEAGTRSVNFWSTYSSPASNPSSTKVGVNGVDVDTAAPGSGSALNLAFAAGATTTITVRYPDAGQVILNARYTGTGTVNGNNETGLVMDGADTFVAVPVGMAVIPSGGACVAGDHTCAKYRKAGEQFTHTVRAACWTADGDTDLSDNPVTPNFQMANIPLSHTRVAPAPGANGTLGVTSVSISSGGSASVTTQSFSEVGVFTVTATPAAYNGETVPPGTSPNIGRIYPDHFALAGPATLTHRSSASPACSPASTFSYLGETLGLGFTLEARNAGGTVTQNYKGAFAFLDPSVAGNLVLGARDTGPGTALLTSRLALVSSAGSFTNGSAAVTAFLGVNRAAAPDGPYTAQFGIAPIDADTVAMTGMDFDGDAVAGNERRNLGVTAALRFGRLRLQGVTGSALIPARLALTLQHWNGTGFVTNTDDSCTALAAKSFALSGYRAPLADCDTAAASGATFASGAGVLTFSKPNPANVGSVVVTAVLGSDSGTYCAASPGSVTPAEGALRGYLQGAWTGGSWDQNPAVRVAFGVYGAQPRNFIFFRENY